MTQATPNPAPPGRDGDALRSASQQVAGAVQRFGAFRKRWSVLEGLSRFILIAPGGLLVWFLLDWAFNLPMWPLVLAFGLVLLLAAWSLIWHVVRPALRRVKIEGDALLIERLHGKLDNQVIGSLQLGREIAAAKPGTPLGYSPELVTELVQRTARTLSQTDTRKLLDLSQARKLLGAAGAVVLVIVVLLVFAPKAAAQRADRLADAWAGILDTLFPVEIKVEPGDVAVLRGRPVELRVKVIGARRKNVELLRGEETGPAGTATIAAVANAPAAPSHLDTLSLREGNASYEVAEAQAPFTYRFRYGGRLSPLYHVRVGDLPDLSAIHYELAYPAYTGVPTRTLVGRIPRLQALAATHVQVSLAATTDLNPDLSYVQWQDGRQPLVVSGRFASFSFTVEHPDRATIFLTGRYGKGFEMKQPASFELIVDRDQPPTIEVLLKNKNLTMFAEEASNFALNWLAEDDFGVAEVGLEYRIDTVDPLLGRTPRSGSMSRLIEPARDRVKGTFAEMFKTLTPALEPGDRVTITLTAKDNNTESGPSLGRSQPVQIIIVRPDLAGFKEQQFGFGADAALGGLRKVKRATNLLVDPDRANRKEAEQKVDRQDLKSRVAPEGFPNGSEDAVGDYFRLLSGEK